jgi:hypothetical protein
MANVRRTLCRAANAVNSSLHRASGMSVAAGQQRDILWKKLVARASFFANYQRKVERQIPMAILMLRT